MSSLEQVVILAFLASTNAIFLMIPWAFGGSHWIGRFAQGSSEYSKLYEAVFDIQMHISV
jgi:hypothetical protein